MSAIRPGLAVESRGEEGRRRAATPVYLPHVFETADEPVVPSLEPEVPTGTETILLAEDDEAVRRIAVLALSRAG